MLCGGIHSYLSGRAVSHASWSEKKSRLLLRVFLCTTVTGTSDCYCQFRVRCCGTGWARSTAAVPALSIAKCNMQPLPRLQMYVCRKVLTKGSMQAQLLKYPFPSHCNVLRVQNANFKIYRKQIADNIRMFN